MALQSLQAICQRLWLAHPAAGGLLPVSGRAVSGGVDAAAWLHAQLAAARGTAGAAQSRRGAGGQFPLAAASISRCGPALNNFRFYVVQKVRNTLGHLYP